MGSENSSRRSSISNEESSEKKQCWICYDDSDESEDSRVWASPCKCRGTSRWVHQTCVLQWIDEKSVNDGLFFPHCPQCKTKYTIVYSKVNSFVQMLNKIDDVLNPIGFYIAGGAIFCTVYWTAVSYGAITMIQVMGKQEAITMMEGTDPCLLFLMLPAIPAGLIFGKLINLEDAFLKLAQRYTSLFPFLRFFMPSFLYTPWRIRRRISGRAVNFNPIVNPKTNLCTALLLPTTAKIVGKLLFYNSSYSVLCKTLLGGLVCIAINGAVRIYQNHYDDKIAKTRRALDYPDTDDE